MSCHVCAFPFRRANRERVFNNVIVTIGLMEGIRRRKHELESFLESGACGISRSFCKQLHLVPEGQTNSMTLSVPL